MTDRQLAAIHHPFRDPHHPHPKTFKTYRGERAVGISVNSVGRIPSWLASCSTHMKRGLIMVPTNRLNGPQMKRAMHDLDEALEGVGVEDRWKLMRFQEALFLQRPLTASETQMAMRYMPKEGKQGGFGYPVEVMHDERFPVDPSDSPCLEPANKPIANLPRNQPWPGEFWRRHPCKKCEACLERMSAVIS